MTLPPLSRRSLAWIVIPALFVTLSSTRAQQPVSLSVPPLGAGPFVLDTAEQHKIRLAIVTKGLEHPWSLAFLPDGSILVTERPGRLRIVRNGVLDPKPIGGLPDIRTKGIGGLMDIALHPRFAENQLVYFAYTKPLENDRGAPALGRGRLEGHTLTDVRDILVTDSREGNGGLSARIVFGTTSTGGL